MDKVSIVIPCYNVEKYIDKCLDSIVNQTYKDLEIICVDDGSKDSTAKIIKNYAKKDERVKYFSKKNEGVSAARNFGIDNAGGKYLVFIDSDDYVNEKYIEKMVDKIKSDKSDMVVCGFERVYKNKSTRKTIKMDDIIGFKNSAPWNKLYIRKKFEDDFKFPINIWYEDLGTTSKYTMKCKKISILNEPLYYYMQNDSSLMRTYDNRIFDIYDELEIIETFAKKNKIFDENFEGLEFANIYHVLVGTSFRASFLPEFDTEMLKNIVSYVEKKYPKWYNNEMAKRNLSKVYKIYLFFIKKRKFKFLCFTLKRLNKHLYL